MQSGLFFDLGIVEPDDNPLSYLEEEEGRGGRGRPPRRPLVAPVDPKLAVSQAFSTESCKLRSCQHQSCILT